LRDQGRFTRACIADDGQVKRRIGLFADRVEINLF